MRDNKISDITITFIKNDMEGLNGGKVIMITYQAEKFHYNGKTCPNFYLRILCPILHPIFFIYHIILCPSKYKDCYTITTDIIIYISWGYPLYDILKSYQDVWRKD